MTVPQASPGLPPPARPLRRRLSAAALLLLAIIILSIAAAWGYLRFAILPRIDSWRAPLERHATQSLGIKVEIGALRARNTGWAPDIELIDLKLVDTQGHTVLLLPRVEAKISWVTLWPSVWAAHEVRLSRLVIEAPELSVRVDPQGRWWIAGMALSPSSGAQPPGALDWLLTQDEIRIEHGRLHWLNQAVQGSGAREALMSKLDVRLRNTGWPTHRRHSLDIAATPPPSWGQPFTLHASFLQPRFDVEHRSEIPVADWSTWQGQAQASFSSIDLAQLAGQVELPWALDSGWGSLRSSAQFKRGQWQQAEAEVVLQKVRLRLAGDLQPLGLETLTGHVVARRVSQGVHETVQVQAQHLSFRTAEGLNWPDSELRLSWRQPAAPSGAQDVFRSLHVAPLADIEGGDFSASHIDMGVLTALSTRVPLAAPLRDLMISLAVRGQAQQLALAWQGPPLSPRSYSTSGRIDELQLAAAAAPAESASQTAGSTSTPADTHAAPVRPGAQSVTRPAARAAAPAVATAASEPTLEHPMGRPGVDHASIAFKADQDGGTASISIQHGDIVLPGVFEEPNVPMDEFSAQLRWSLGSNPGGPPQVHVEVRNVEFSNADAQGHFEAAWHTGSGSGNGRGQYLPGILQLHGTLTRADATRVARYLPVSIPEHTRHYVVEATRSGKATQVDFTVAGDLWDFPYGKPDRSPGSFNITAQIADADFCYVPPQVLGLATPAPATPAQAAAKSATSAAATLARTAAARAARIAAESKACPLWPLFTGLSGELVFDKQSMFIHRAQAQLGTVGQGQTVLRHVEGRIDHLDHDPELQISGELQGDLGDMLSFVQATPVNGWTHRVLEHAQGGASAQLRLDLRLTLDNMDQSQVQGKLQLTGNSLHFSPQIPGLHEVKGSVDFSRSSLSIRTDARFLGLPVRIEGGTDAQGDVHVAANGDVSAQGLRELLDNANIPPSSMPSAVWNTLHRWSQRLSGQAAAHFELGALHDQLFWSVTSDTVGLGLDLPAPLNKTASAAWPLKVDVGPVARDTGDDTGDPDEPGTSDQELTRVNWADVLQLQMVRDTSTQPERVVRGALGINTGAHMNPSGFNAQINVASLDVDAWSRSLKPASAAAGKAAPGPAASADDLKTLDSVALRAKSVSWMGRSFSNLRLEARAPSNANRWHLDVAADQLRGQLDWMAGTSGGNPQVVARFSRLTLPQARTNAEALGSPLSASSSPAAAGSTSTASWPDLDVGIDDFVVDELKLGKLALIAKNHVGDEGLRTWHVDRLDLLLPEAHLSASGQATAATGGSPPKTSLDFTLELNNSGSLLTRLGEAQTIKGGKGRIEGQVHWSAAPWTLDIPSLGGKLHLGVDNGQFLRVEPGAAKLLGVLSLQSLPRRLTLDFRDIFLQGFAFDHIDGDVDINMGVASTRNLRMNGVQAVVFMEGQADLKQETQDVHVWVLPEINAGTASLAYAAINPAVGLGTFLAQMFLRKPFIEANTREFRVTGAWKDPQIQRIAHRSGTTPPEATRASSAPSSGGSDSGPRAVR